MFIPNFCCVIDNLYLSGIDAAIRHDVHKIYKFELVVNCSNDLPFVKNKNKNTIFFKVPINDNLKSKEILKMTKLLQDDSGIVNKILQILDQQKPVLIHCHQGRQRSPTLIIACLLKLGIYDNLDDAIAFLKTRKSDVFYLNCNFKQSLIEFINKQKYYCFFRVLFLSCF